MKDGVFSMAQRGINDDDLNIIKCLTENTKRQIEQKSGIKINFNCQIWSLGHSHFRKILKLDGITD